MRKILISILFSFLVIIPFESFCQKDNSKVKVVEIYLNPWNAFYKAPRTIENFKKLAEFYYKIKEPEFNNMFLDFDDCVEKISSSKIYSDTIGHSLNALVILKFTNKNIKIFFDDNGNFYYDNKWFRINYQFYFWTFKDFSDEIIPNELLEKSKQKTKNNLWISE